MAQYDNPDQWFGSKDGTVQVGDGPTREPIAQSLSATNRAVYLMLPIVKKLETALDGLASKVVGAIAEKRWQYGNQDHKPEKDRGTNNLFEAVQATNTYVYSPVFGVKALGDRLTAIEAKLDALSKPQQ